MNHSFNIEIAKTYGIEAAIILENLAHWTHYNIANRKNIHDGKIWVYNSRRAWNILFPYIHERTIGRVLERLIKQGILVTANYNKIAYDKTKWFAFADNILLDRYFKIDENKSLGQNVQPMIPKCPTDDTKVSNRKSQNVQPIPIINTNINTDINTIYETWNNHNLIVHKKLTDRIKRKINTSLKDYSLNDIITAIKNYGIVLNNIEYYWTHRWTLFEFLQRGIEKFMDNANPLDNYKDKENKQTEPSRAKKRSDARIAELKKETT